MGSYTQYQKLYKVAEGDTVDVENDLNYNWDRLDDRVRRICEWAPTEFPFITGNEQFENGFNYLKRESCAKYTGWDGAVYQDTQAFVPQWNLVTPAAGWQNATTTTRLMWANIGGKVFWRGKIRLASGGEIPVKTIQTVVSTLPAGAIPSTVKHAFQPGGNSPAGQPCVHMIVFNTTGTIQVFKYGTAQGTAATDRYINFSGIEFPQ